ncbi:septal ring lytic transglycosylase RlpA family protein [candidate division WOR-3 bacterium]|nr:septal ring lytic transglycosylase RlpA family protein [candidate division WOR-3 bacterium]
MKNKTSLLQIFFLLSLCGCATVMFNSATTRVKRTGESRGTVETVRSDTSSSQTDISSPDNSLTGYGTYYGEAFHGKRTANGETFNMYALTAAHRTLPFGTLVRVVNLENSKSVVVRINDRGPVDESIIIDLSYEAARRIDLLSKGMVRIEVLR